MTLKKTSAALLAVVLTGCAGNPRPHKVQVPDWESQDVASPTIPPPSTPVLIPAPVPTPAPPIPSPPRQVTETWIPLNRWCKANGLREPFQLVPQGGITLPAYAVNTSNGVFVLRAGSQSAYWDGLEFRLGFAPQLIDGQTFIHALDLKKTIQPLLSGSAGGFLRGNSIIVIDPGHGGENPGTKSVLGHHYEKEFTLDWARRLQPLLAANGWAVFLTRTNDTDLALSNRVAFAEQHKAALFLSLHFNSSAPKEDQAGLETYCLTPAGMPSTVTRGFADDLGFTFPNNSFDAQNLQLAFRVHRALLQVNGFRDRGVRRARFLGVLRWQQRPAILVEGGYLSNPSEARLISDPAYRQKLAEAVARALCEELGSSSIQRSPVTVQEQAVRSQKSDVHSPTAPLP